VTGPARPRGAARGLSLALLALALAAAGARAAADGEHVARAWRGPSFEPLWAEAVQGDSAFALEVTRSNLVGVSVTNYGFVGNNYVSLDSPSCEYPLGTKYEHMVRGGLWVGAKAIDENGAFIGVTTGAVDGQVGAKLDKSTEFTPVGRTIEIRSTLLKDPHFNRKAVSEQDFIGTYNDLTPKHAEFNNEPHHPMGIAVRQENYTWSFSDLQHFVIFHYVIKNIGIAPLDSVYAGFYAELSTGRAPYHSPWFSRKWIVWDDSLLLFREHYCQQGPIPSGCNLNYVPPWMGFRVLGVRDRGDTANQRLKPGMIRTVGAWTYSLGDPARDQDTERYAIMNNGGLPDFSIPDLQPGTGDPAEIVSVGPFVEVDPGDSVSFDVALVGGDDVPAIQQHSRVAQRAFDNNYIVPIPPPSPQLKVVARDGGLDLYWDDSPESAVDPTSPNPQDFEGYRVYLGEDRLHPSRTAEFDAAGDTTRFNTGFGAITLATPVTTNGVTYSYKYSIDGLRNGFSYFAAVTSFDTGTPEIESLESGITQNKTLAVPAPTPGEVKTAGRGVTVFPNPYRVEARWDQGRLVRDHYLWFANLPARCTLRIFTLSGDLVFETNFDGANYHGENARGVYNPRRDLDVDPPTLSGASFAWDLITRQGQAAATGLYLYTVEDKSNGKRETGKFLIVKSDREEF